MTLPPDSWSETYCVGHAGLDELHRRMIDGLADIQQAAAQGRPRADILGLLDDWLDLFARHARFEERLMDGLTLPAALQHREIHMAEHLSFLHESMAIRNALAHGADIQASLGDLSAHLVAVDLIRRDFEMIGLLMHEGIAL